MSASDEYRLFALTIPASDIIHRLALAEDVRVMLVWLETQGYGDAVDHIDDAFGVPTCVADINSSIVAPRLGWLLKQVALEPELAYLTWPPAITSGWRRSRRWGSPSTETGSHDLLRRCW